MLAPRLSFVEIARRIVGNATDLRWGILPLIGLVIGTFTSEVQGDQLETIRARGKIIWGADAEGGGPYVYPDPVDPTKVIGFEVDLMNALAAKLGVKAEFRQTDWATLLTNVENGQIDVVFNGYELTPERVRDYYCSRPYYAYGLQLMASTTGKIDDWKDLEDQAKGPFEIGALSASMAERYLEQDRYKNTVTITAFNGNVDAFERVAGGQLDAALQDDCVAYFYAHRFPTLKFIGRPVGGGYYTAIMKKSEPGFGHAFDEAIGALISSGELEDVYDKWEMGGRIQALTLRGTTKVPPAPSESIVDVLKRTGPLLINAAGMTVFLSVVSMPLAILLGILLAISRLYGPRPLQWLSTLYVEVIRGTPLMLQLYAIFFLLPRFFTSLGLEVDIPPLVAAIMGLAVNYSAYEAEIYRAGLQAIPRGQMEAALSLGMSGGQAVRRVILPQAFRLVIPPVTNDFIALFKDTSVCSVVAVIELTKQYNILALSTGAIVELAAVTALLYMAMSYPLSLLARWSEQQIQTDR